VRRGPNFLCAHHNQTSVDKNRGTNKKRASRLATVLWPIGSPNRKQESMEKRTVQEKGPNKEKRRKGGGKLLVIYIAGAKNSREHQKQETGSPSHAPLECGGVGPDIVRVGRILCLPAPKPDRKILEKTERFFFSTLRKTAVTEKRNPRRTDT